ncbi:Anaphase-promoting complex subunit CDC26 [Operophtera brumata]|uniref:Anaphase-promoting complex subunit CDC26 n=1 Tax=Operophtera brumata TaxID=104452 RepID=A0A0L7L627_OPEBR|nr:Anaphase-promoting complex subunit CDC26 [Operophtera brumata]KOB70724.1 Anaphase-promoting complex subunit CDC26 [Operophtera brumata]
MRSVSDLTMIRRPLTEITLKLDDLHEYETFRRDQANNSMISTEMPEQTPKSLSTGLKSAEEIHNRIGYAPKKKPCGPSPV